MFRITIAGLGPQGEILLVRTVFQEKSPSGPSQKNVKSKHSCGTEKSKRANREGENNGKPEKKQTHKQN